MSTEVVSSPTDNPGQTPPSEMSQPSTPVPAHASLPGQYGSPETTAKISDIQAARVERAKYASPAPPSSSMTPPPSSQMPQLTRAAVRTPTPPTPHLSSPPPTNRPSTQLGTVNGGNINFTSEQIHSATPEALRSMVNELAAALREVRTSAAHYKLQYNMLRIDSSEASNRMAVELAMAQREVDVLQQNEERRRGSGMTPASAFQEPVVTPADAALMNELSRQCQTLQAENANLRDALTRSRRVLEDREGEMLGLHEENVRLKTRIRKNREHINALLEHSWDGSPFRSTFSTPRRSATRPHLLPDSTVGSSSGARREQPFEALLLADKVLSQDVATTTAPSTPARSTPAGKARYGHARGTQSLSSLPSTPTRPRAAAATAHPDPAAFRTPPGFQPINAAAVAPPHSAPTAHCGAKARRRESSDSTITASSAGGGAEADVDVPESQASQAATSMLRRSTSGPRSSPTSARLPPPASSAAKMARPGGGGGGGGGVQTKLFGHVTKPGGGRFGGGNEKRQLSGGATPESPSKKGRLGDAVGLGIGGLSGSPRR